MKTSRRNLGSLAVPWFELSLAFSETNPVKQTLNKNK